MATPAGRPSAPAPPGPARFRLPDGSRSAQSVWVWRAFLFLSLVALGLCVSFAAGGRQFYAISWGMIAAGWFGISMFLWRAHVRLAHAEEQPARTPEPPARTSGGTRRGKRRRPATSRR